MLLHVGCEFGYDSPSPTPSVMLVEPHPDPTDGNRVVRQRWDTDPEIGLRPSADLFRNRCRRFVLPTGATTLRYDAIVEVSGDPDPVDLGAPQLLVDDLPDDVLVYTLASRYCLTESLSQVAWRLFGNTDSGWARVQAVCDWIHLNIQYGLLRSTPLTTAVDVYVAGGGMCRDFAHLAITFCRALNIPARYVFGYMPDIGVPGPFPPMDFHAWFEVYLGDRWWTFDARFNIPRIGRIPIGIGRDAVDVAMVTSYGPAAFRRMIVWTDEATDADISAVAGGERDASADPTNGHASEDPDGSEALVVGRGSDREEAPR